MKKLINPCSNCGCCEQKEDGTCEGACVERGGVPGRHVAEIEMKSPVHDSTRIRRAGYYPRAGLLVIEFVKSNKGMYVYAGVPQHEYIELLNAPSAGKHFDAHLKNRYEFRAEANMPTPDGTVPLWAHFIQQFRALEAGETAHARLDMQEPIKMVW